MYSRYFSPGQKIQLTTQRDDKLPSRREAINVLFHSYELGYFDVTVPHGWPINEGTPFCEGRPVEIISERYGLWLKSTAEFHSHPSDKMLRLRMNQDLCLFRHCPRLRVDTHIGLRYSTQRGNLPTLHRHWRQQINKLTSLDAALTAPSFAQGAVNLSASGIRIPLQATLKNHDIFLLMMALDKASDPICTLTETIWTAPSETGQGIIAGLQFLNILRQDQQRIEGFVKQNLPKRSGSAAGSPSDSIPQKPSLSC